MKPAFAHRIARAAELAERDPAARDLLAFYSSLARFQQQVFDDVAARADSSIDGLLPHFSSLLSLVAQEGPAQLTEFAKIHLGSENMRRSLLSECWEGDQASIDPAPLFFARALLQPFAEYLAARGTVESQAADPTCPFCGARPGVAVLRGEGDGGKRSLICSLCSTEWLYRRILCPGCGEENKDRLPVYVASEFPHVRVEACDSCKTYLKSVDLTKNGLAVPVVDEIATVALNIWAEEHGYSKLTPNLLGM